MNPANVFEATRLQTMYQELMPFGIDPDPVFATNQSFMRLIAEDRSSLSLDCRFDILVNPPTLLDNSARLFVSIHLGRLFGCIPIYLAKQLLHKQRVTFLMSRQSRASVPNWKNEVYQQAEKQLGIDVLYAEDKSSLLTLARRLRNREVVFTYLDAIVPHEAANRMHPVKLLSRRVQFPTGLLELAMKSGASITPVFCRTLGEHQVLAFGNERANNDAQPAVPVSELAQSIASDFGKALLTAPAEWTQWDYCTANSLVDTPLDIFGLKKKVSHEMRYQNERYVFNYQLGVVEHLTS